MKHIAYISAEYPHKSTPSAGGIGSFIKNMGQILVKKGYTVTVFLCFAKKHNSWTDVGINIIEIPCKQTPFVSAITNRVTLANTIKKYINEIKIDIIEAPDWEGLHAFCNFKIPLITRLHGSVTYFNHLQQLKKPKLLYFLEKKALHKSNNIIAVSAFAGEVTRKLFGVSTKKIQTIYNGVDTKTFKNVENNTKSKDVILYFGTLARKKGVIDLAQIFNSVHITHPNVRLLLVGKDSIDVINKTSTWKIIASKLTPSALQQTSYVGVVPYNEIKSYIVDATVCVFPSFAEAFPISWLEAMAMQKPIVASSIGWAKEAIVDNESGLLESPNNHKVFAKKIIKLLNNKSLAEKMGLAAKQRVEGNFDQNKLVVQNINYYKKVLNYE